jgi:hypothetical protein
MTELELTYPPSVNHYYTKWCQYVQKAGKHVVKVAVGDRGMATEPKSDDSSSWT